MPRSRVSASSTCLVSAGVSLLTTVTVLTASTLLTGGLLAQSIPGQRPGGYVSPSYSSYSPFTGEGGSHRKSSSAAVPSSSSSNNTSSAAYDAGSNPSWKSSFSSARAAPPTEEVEYRSSQMISNSPSSSEASSAGERTSTEQPPTKHVIPIRVVPLPNIGENNSQSASRGAAVPPVEGGSVGCFDDAGTWISKREYCAADQGRFLRPAQPPVDETTDIQLELRPAPPIPDREAELRLDAQFNATVSQDDQRASFLRLVDDSAFVVGNARAGVAHDAAALAALSDTLSWLDSRRAEAGLERTITEWNAEAAAVRARMTETSAVVASAEASAPAAPIPVAPDIQAILMRLEGIVSRVPEVHALVQRAGVAVPDVSLLAALDARSALDAVPSCPTLKSCRQLPLVVDALEAWRDGMRDAVHAANRDDLLVKIEDSLR